MLQWRFQRHHQPPGASPTLPHFPPSIQLTLACRLPQLTPEQLFLRRTIRKASPVVPASLSSPAPDRKTFPQHKHELGGQCCASTKSAIRRSFCVDSNEQCLKNRHNYLRPRRFPRLAPLVVKTIVRIPSPSFLAEVIFPPITSLAQRSCQ